MIAEIHKAFCASGLNRFELAKRANVPYSTIHRFLGKGRDIKLSNVQRLCDVLGLRLAPDERKRR